MDARRALANIPCGFALIYTLHPFQTSRSIKADCVSARRKLFASPKVLRRHTAVTHVICCEPLEQSLTLPKFHTIEYLEEERCWLANAITEWLDSEWKQPVEQPVHAAIADRTSQIYARQRMEGEDDLGGILLAIGQELQSFDMSTSFVGPFNIANKAAELLLSRSLGPIDSNSSNVTPSRYPTWSMENEQKANERRSHAARSGTQQREDDGTETRSGPSPPSLIDVFERHKFLMDLLDGTTGSTEISGAVALIAGFKYDAETEKWSGKNVTDPFFSSFGDSPPVDVLSNDAVLKYMEERIGEDDEDGRIAEGLDMVVETFHGQVLTRILREQGDDDFRRREIVAKYFHMFGGF